jgi:predicted nucleic acid-binding protein
MQVSRWGNSLAVRLPKALVDQLGLKEGDELDVVAARAGAIEIETRQARRQRALDNMAARNWAPPHDYRFDRDEAERARALFKAGGKLSVQVLNEFAAVSRRKLNQTWPAIADAIDDAMALVDPPLPLSLDLHVAARALAEAHHLSFYDALIVAAAIEADCDTLYSEDMQHGRRIGRLEICNPFLAEIK